MSSNSQVNRIGLPCDANDLEAAEALVQSGGIDSLLSETDPCDDKARVRKNIRVRIARCLDFLAREAGIQLPDDRLLRKIDEVFGSHSTISRTVSAGRVFSYPEAVIYCVDDEPLVLNAYSRLLRSSKYPNVRAFTNPTEALDAFTRSTTDGDIPHLVISDQTMPELLGTELFGKIRELSQKHQPSLLMISDQVGNERVRGLAVKHKFDAAMKPINFDDFRRHVADGLQRHPVLKWINGLFLVEEELGRSNENGSDAG